MAFLRIEGLPVDALIEDFEISDQSVEAFNRTLGDSLEGISYSDKKEISLTTPPLDPLSARSLEGWVRGRRHLWTFNRVDGATTRFTRFSDDGGLALPLSGYTSTASALFGAWAIQINPAITNTVTATFGSEGDWTVAVYHKAVITNASYTFYCVRSIGGVIDYFQSAASVSVIYNLSATAASGFLRANLIGRLGTTNSNATSHFDNLIMAPYAFTYEMIQSAATPTYGLTALGNTRPPYVTVFGDGLHKADINANGAGEPGPMICKGFVETVDTEPVVLNGAFQYNARRLKIRLLEK